MPHISGQCTADVATTVSTIRLNEKKRAPSPMINAAPPTISNQVAICQLMAGGTTVAIYPTELAETVRYVLEHSEASLLFIGKLDNVAPVSALPEGLPCIALPLAPDGRADTKFMPLGDNRPRSSQGVASRRIQPSVNDSLHPPR